jgi:arsenate reductase
VYRVIFACVPNAGRSQMAAAFFNQLADRKKTQAVSAKSYFKICAKRSLVEL